jgi:hypothetical protein
MPQVLKLPQWLRVEPACACRQCKTTMLFCTAAVLAHAVFDLFLQLCCAAPATVAGPVSLLWFQPDGGRPAFAAGGICMQQGPSGPSPAGARPLR